MRCRVLRRAASFRITRNLRVVDSPRCDLDLAKVSTFLSAMRGVHGRIQTPEACSTLMAALTLCLLSIGTAQAELFWPHSRSWGWDDYEPFWSHHYRSWRWGDYEPFRQRRQRANKGYELEQKPKSLEVVKGPLQVIMTCPRIFGPSIS